MQQRLSPLKTQVLRFVVVGLIATAIDFAILAILHYGGQMNYLLAATIAFILSTIFNYWASMTYIFQSKFAQDQKHHEFMIFVFLSVLGLLLTNGLLYLFVDLIKFEVMIAKVIVTAFVMVFNFVSRKIFLEDKSARNEELI